MIDMQEKQRKLMREALKAFGAIIGSREIAKARSAWEDIAQTHDGQLLLFKEAKAGNLDAINYLFYKLQPQIMKVFWTNFLGPDPRARRNRIESGDQYDFIFFAYQALLVSYYRNLPEEEAEEAIRQNIIKAGRTPTEEEVKETAREVRGEISQLDSFDPSQFSEGTDLVQKFGYYMTAVLKNKATSFNREQALGGIHVGVVRGDEKEMLKNVSYEAHFENAEEASEFDNFVSTEDQDIWEHFSQDPDLDAGKAPTSRQLLKAFLVQGDKFDVASVADEFEVTKMTIRNRLGAMASVLERNDLDRATFDRLLTSPGGLVLAKSL